MVLDSEAGDLNWVRERYELQEVERDSMRCVLEAAVTLAVAGDIGPGLLPDWQYRWAPQFAAIVSPGESLTGSFDHGVSWFSRLLSDHV